MSLPRLLLLTDRRQCSGPLVAVVRAAVAAGVRWVVLREKDLPGPERAGLADALRALLAPVNGRLVLGGVESHGGDAVHLSAGDALPTPRPALVGRSCHDAGEVARAGDEGCDWVTVSPVHLTASKPGYGPALGVAGLRALAAVPGAPPVYALGGVGPGQAVDCLLAGAHGVAVMGAVMRADDPGRVSGELLAVLGSA